MEGPEAVSVVEAGLAAVADPVVDSVVVEEPVVDLELAEAPVVDLAVPEVALVEGSEVAVEDAAVSRLFACLFSPCTITLHMNTQEKKRKEKVR